MQSIIIDIINDKAVKLLQDMELLQLIHLRKGKESSSTLINWAVKHKGTMKKQPLFEIDNQLNELRNS